MQQATTAKAPTHLWIVGILSLIWTGFGAYDYTMTRMKNTDYLASMMPEVDPNPLLAWVDGFPIYAQIGWGLGVWGALLGSILLLMRSRYAVWAFALSLLGAVVSFGAQYMGPPPPPEMTAGALKYMPLVIILLAAAQLWYANMVRKGGVLR